MGNKLKRFPVKGLGLGRCKDASWVFVVYLCPGMNNYTPAAPLPTDICMVSEVVIDPQECNYSS